MAAATLDDLRIDEATWQTGSPDRRHEWRLAAQEIVQEGAFDLSGELPHPPPRPLRGVVRLATTGISLELAGPDGPWAAEELPYPEVRPVVDEYIQTCVEMNKLGVGSHSPRLEALDIAKRLTHDEAGELIVTLCRRVRPDHATARRLFTLFVTLLHDTTQLVARPHAFHY